KAWQAITDRRLQDKETLNSLFNELRQLRHQVAINAGFTNFRDYMFEAMGRFDYTPEDCTHFHQAIAESIVPILQQQANERQRQLPVENLRPWDMDVDPLGREALRPFSSADEIIEK